MNCQHGGRPTAWHYYAYQYCDGEGRNNGRIRKICVDMYEGYANAVRQELPQARIVVDRFHVAKAYRQGADKLRVKVQRELKSGLKPDEYEALKGAMWLFRRDPDELSEEERRRLELLFECADS